eukprot:TRINITY_DN14003_c0_g2_i2.p2 TRINITY_DN14003_c0_g2~~TRINITY_DN14003_c0_g2_i2.p2  ORF type:complete len:317 (+),score=69.31 TRINITY_DN14003_c0_g2_i2:50-952(+)
MGADELDLPLCAYAAAARRQGGQRRAPAKPAQQRWRAPRTHLHAEMVRQRRNPEPRDRSEVKRALEALTQGDAEAVEALLSRAGEEPVAEEWQQRYKEGGQAYWDQFYRQSTVNFFKDRNYLREEFGELMPADIAAAPKRWVENLSAEDRPAPETAAEAAEAAAGRKVLLELGCAVGNGALPMLRANRGLFAFACDLSPVAIRLLREKEEYACGRCLAFACDVTRGEGEQPTPEHTPMESLVPADSVDFATLLFVVSAIDPAKHRDVYARICGRRHARLLLDRRGPHRSHGGCGIRDCRM